MVILLIYLFNNLISLSFEDWKMFIFDYQLGILKYYIVDLQNVVKI